MAGSTYADEWPKTAGEFLRLWVEHGVKVSKKSKSAIAREAGYRQSQSLVHAYEKTELKAHGVEKFEAVLRKCTCPSTLIARAVAVYRMDPELLEGSALRRMKALQAKANARKRIRMSRYLPRMRAVFGRYTRTQLVRLHNA